MRLHKQNDKSVTDMCPVSCIIHSMLSTAVWCVQRGVTEHVSLYCVPGVLRAVALNVLTGPRTHKQLEGNWGPQPTPWCNARAPFPISAMTFILWPTERPASVSVSVWQPLDVSQELRICLAENVSGPHAATITSASGEAFQSVWGR